jgi:Kef-type K+ transport system membrane component KefB/nucleotide-binding universal stress UspA family protein
MDKFRNFRAKTPVFALFIAGAALFLATPALAAEAGKAGPSEVVFLAQLLVLMLAGRLLGEAMQRIGQPSVMGQLLAGILLGPSVLGLVWPDLQHALFPPGKEQKAMIDAVSQFGILLLLLLTGMETDLKLVRTVGRAAVSISLTGVAVPFACGVALGLFMPDDLLPDGSKRVLTALFLGTALSISSIKIVAAVVREMNFTRRNLGQIIVSSAILEDTIGWIIIAVIFSLAEAGSIDVVSVGKSLIGTAVFLIASFTVGRRLVFFLIRWSNDTFQTEFPVITTILVIMGAMALTTHFIGVHFVLGAFIAGVLIGESPILTKHIDEQLRGLIVAFFMPVFFGMAGISADLTILKDPELALLAACLIVIASLGKFAGAFIGGEIGGLHRREALALACGMNARGSTEVIIATIGLSMGALTQNLFTMIVAMAFVTTMAMPPMLRWALARVPMRKAEKERLEREEFERKGFVSSIERLLLAVDDSPNGKFAARLAGFIAGRRGTPTTVLPLETSGKSKMAATPSDPAADQDVKSSDVLKAAAESANGASNEDTPRSPVSITVRNQDKPTQEAIASEAEKGYDLLFVGMKTMRTKSGGFQKDIAPITTAFEGPTALVIGRDTHLDDPQQCPMNILVPFAGTDVSRRAAEVAIAIARACQCPITALYVANTPAGSKQRRGRATREQERAIIKEIVTMADHYDVEVKTATDFHSAPDKAIIAAAKKGKQDLIIMGVNRRPGDTLFFGDTAAAVLEHAPTSIVLVAT